MGIKCVQGSVTVNSGGYENVADGSLFESLPLTFTIPSPMTPSTYAWRIFDGNGTFVSSSTSATFVTSLIGAGTYTIRETVSNGTLTLTLKSNSANAGPHFARGVVTANVSDLTAFTVAGNDGITYAAGEVVLLAAQTTAADCGLYMVGKVASGTAPLTRVPDLFTGQNLKPGTTVEVSEGTQWAGSTWKAMATGTKVIGTNDPVFYPRSFRKVITLVSGTTTIGAGGGSEALFLWSTTGSTAGPASSVVVTRDTVSGTVTPTIMYACPVGSRIAGKAGTAAVAINAAVAAGTTNTADNSTVLVNVTNW